MKVLRFTLERQADSAAPTHRWHGRAFMQHDFRSHVTGIYATDPAEALTKLATEASIFGLSPALIAAECERASQSHQLEAVAA